MTENQPKKILVSVTNSWGRDKVYPECEDAHRFRALTGTSKTLTANALGLITELGYEIVDVSGDKGCSVLARAIAAQ
jgi:hypothetical protein